MLITEKSLYDKIAEARSKAKDVVLEVHTPYVEVLQELVHIIMAYQTSLYKIYSLIDNGIYTDYETLVGEVFKTVEDALIHINL